MRLAALALLLSTTALAQGMPIKSGADTNLMTVDSNKSGKVWVNDKEGDSIDVTEGYLKMGQPTQLFFDGFEGTTLNTMVWTASGAYAGSMALTVSVANGLWLNSGSITTAAATANIASRKLFNVGQGESPVVAMTSFVRNLTGQAQEQIDFGFSDAAAATEASNGCFFRWNTAGEFRAYLFTNGTQLQSAALTAPSANVMHTLYVALKYDECVFYVDDTIVATIAQLGTGVPFVANKVPVFARVLNGTTPATAPTFKLYNVTVLQDVIDLSRDYSRQMVSSQGRLNIQGPAVAGAANTFAKTANWTASTAPTTRTLTATTTASETTLCGLVNITPTTAANGDYILFDYTVPTGFQLHVTSIKCGFTVAGAAQPATALGLQWWASNSSATTLATADTFGGGTAAPSAWGPRPVFFGFSSLAASAAIGAGPTIHDASLAFDPDFITESGQHFQVGIRALQAQTATASEIFAINCACPGWFE